MRVRVRVRDLPVGTGTCKCMGNMEEGVNLELPL